MTFGRLLREYREHRGWSLGDLSKATHFSRGHLSDIENGRKPATDSLVRLCDEALRASGVLITAAGDELVAKLGQTPWQTAELVQRLQASDATPATLERLHATLVELCCQYSWRDAMELREEAQGWLRHVGELLRRPVGLRAHSELLAAGGWLALLAGCVEYDLGMRAAAESTRTAALQLGGEAGHAEISGWAHEMSSWFALTQGRLLDAIDSAEAGHAVARQSSVHVQLIAQEAKARARLGQSGVEPLLDSGREILDRLPYPDRPDNHFTVDPAKWEYYAMDVYRIAGDDQLARQYGTAVIQDNLAPDGSELSPMRIGESRVTLAIVAARQGDLEEAATLGLTGLHGSRQSRPSLVMVAGELVHELTTRYPNEPLTHHFTEAARTL